MKCHAKVGGGERGSACIEDQEGGWGSEKGAEAHRRVYAGRGEGGGAKHVCCSGTEFPT